MTTFSFKKKEVISFRENIDKLISQDIIQILLIDTSMELQQHLQ